MTSTEETTNYFKNINSENTIGSQILAVKYVGNCDIAIVEANEPMENVVLKSTGGYGTRHTQCLLLFTGLLVAYSMRVNIAIGIVAMVDGSSNPNIKVYDWDQETCGVIISSFFWGYVVAQIPAALLAQRFGARIVFFIATLLFSIFTILTPYAASLGWEYMCASRVIQGCCQSCVFPSVHTLLARWVHPSERGFLNTFSYSGVQAGTVIMLGVSGIIASSIMGWPGIFYLSGGFGLIWASIWFCFGSNCPGEHPTISKEERNFIESSVATTSNRRRATPWKQILTSKPFIALFIVNSAQNWGFWTLLTEIPSYIHGVLYFDIKTNSLLSALPYLTMWILGLSMSVLSDFIMNHGYVTVAVGRKIFNTIGHVVPIACLIGLGYVGHKDTTTAIALLTIAVGVNSAALVGILVNHMDLAPNYAGVLVALTNGIGNFPAIIGPLFTGFVVTDSTDPDLWRIVFFVTAGIFFVGNLTFVIFGRATVQSWNDEPPNNRKESISAAPK